MMIPFMGAQSLVIGKMFGEGFQYGKRKISAMPNEEFNKLTFENMMSNAREEIKASVPTMAAAMQDMKPLVDVVVREFLQYINEVSKTLQEVTVTGLDEAAHLVGTHVGHPPAAPVVQPIPPGPTIQQPFSPAKPTPFKSNPTLRKKVSFLQLSVSGSRVTFIRTPERLVLNLQEMKNMLKFQKQMVVRARTLLSGSNAAAARKMISNMESIIENWI